MLHTLLEKAIFEDDFCIDLILRSSQLDDFQLSLLEKEAMFEHINEIHRFFNITTLEDREIVNKKINNNTKFRNDFLSYTKEKLAFMLVSHSKKEPQAIVWVTAR